MGYYFKGRVLDWCGLTDREIAKRSQSYGRVAPETVYNQKPEYLILYSNEPRLGPESMHSDMARGSRVFFDHPDFRHYTQIASLLFWDGRWHVVMERRLP